ncbi:MAG: hypothetical protein NT032_00770, partial [Actinobacteria bacterium]|nr:hypothetical protein [Actinomycetota bacterium]
MASNTYPEFIGISALVEKHSVQVAQFEQWAAEGNWQAFHDNHFDWWAFPIDKPSNYAFAYAVFDQEIAPMKREQLFMNRHRIGADLLLLSWGWHSATGQLLETPAPGQQWANWPIRLAKCARSMWLFGQVQQYESCVEYAQYLQTQGKSFGYNGRD